MPYKAVIFDMDGLMCDTETYHCEAWGRMLEDFGLKIEEKFFAGLVGVSTNDNAVTLKNKFNINETPEELLRIRRAHYLEIIGQKRLIPTRGLREVFETIELKGLKKAVGTSSPNVEVSPVLTKVLKECGIKVPPEKFFDAIVTSDIVEKVKPSPEIYLKCLEKLRLRPEDCIVLEDSSSGVKSAKAAGMHCIAYKSKYSQHQDLSIADKVVDDLTEVPLMI